MPFLASKPWVKMPVTMYTSEDSGAPELKSGTLGNFTTWFKKILVDGYGSKPPLGWSVIEGNKKILIQSKDNTSRKYTLTIDHSIVERNILLTAAYPGTTIDNFVQPWRRRLEAYQNKDVNDYTYNPWVALSRQNTPMKWIVIGHAKAFWCLFFNDYSGYNWAGFFFGDIPGFYESPRNALLWRSEAYSNYGFDRNFNVNHLVSPSVAMPCAADEAYIPQPNNWGGLTYTQNQPGNHGQILSTIPAYSVQRFLQFMPESYDAAYLDNVAAFPMFIAEAYTVDANYNRHMNIGQMIPGTLVADRFLNCSTTASTYRRLQAPYEDYIMLNLFSIYNGIKNINVGNTFLFNIKEWDA